MTDRRQDRARARGARDGGAPARVLAVALALALTFGCAAERGAAAEEPLTLDRALAIARRANARLPVASADVIGARQALGGARARRGPRLSLSGDMVYAPPFADYGTPVDEERLQAVGLQPIYHGGRISGGIDQARANLAGASARYRVAEKDVELDVRSTFAHVEALEAIARVRRDGLERLRRYVAFLELRSASGQGLELDLLRTRAQIATAEAEVHAIDREVTVAKLALNTLMGRDPMAPLTLAPIARIATPDRRGAPWETVPELRDARAAVKAAEASITIVRSGRRPTVDFVADGGLLGGGLGGGVGSQTWSLPGDLGASVSVNLSWPLWDLGIYRAQLAQAKTSRWQAERSVTVAWRQARLEWERAVAAMARLEPELAAREKALGFARDAYLAAESAYRGGVGTALDVVTAYRTWIADAESYQTARYEYLDAAARAVRWGSP